MARQLFERSGGSYFRLSKHCREHWLNYIDPSKLREVWSEAEDEELLRRVSEKGKKWAQLAGVMSRTEHDVKNRFNSLLSREQKCNPELNKEYLLIEHILARINDNHHANAQDEQQREEEKPEAPGKTEIVISHSHIAEEEPQPGLCLHHPLEESPQQDQEDPMFKLKDSR